ncbi:MAG: universal stress protein [Flavobacteriaceae bacterium]|nr:universal stress protein [Flavobacteriaceae bacterium]
MKNILVPVGSSGNAVSHLQYVIDFAKEFGAKVFVVQIYNVYTKAGTLIRVEDIIERESMNFLKDHVAKVDTKGVEVIIKTFRGKLIETLELACKTYNIDLVAIEPRTNSIEESVYLGNTSGKMVKQTDLPILIVPEGLKYKPITSILFALKSAVMKREKVLRPLVDIKTKFKARLTLMLVKTPYYNEGDFDVKKEMSKIADQIVKTESPTTFQAVLENYKEYNPDLLTVVRRKRGFFSKLWEKNTILKKDFHSTTMPVLVLRGLK